MSKRIPKYKRRLSNSQIVCITVLWFLLAYIVLTNVERIDGMTIITLIISATLVIIPIYRELQRRKKE